ncbi:MAG TPA: ammonia-forming cytochrome c nitrite reductase subunit c552 [Firmicutes bacterium]|nr:ammonia-forming cytochrome c nitrite reductase subunit c552 [Bacillota bacterium]
MNGRKLVAFGLVMLFLLLFLTGCAGGNSEQENNGQQQEPPAQKETEALDINALTAQWAESAHSNILLSPAQRDNCVLCHDGGAFAANQAEVGALERDFNISIDCRACHTGRGVDLMEAGTVDIPSADNVQGGTGALCMACHNSRHAGDVKDERRAAPHSSSQADVFTATGGIRAEDFNYGSTGAHTGIKDSCVGCHLTETEAGFASHTFGVESVQAACGQCHQGITDANLAAGGDYDGDSNKEGLQTEVEGLLALVAGAVKEKTGGGEISSSHGSVVITTAGGEEMEELPDEVYQAAYNYLLVSSDGSLGIHNPTYAVQLLQQSYKWLTGEDVPGAELK